MAEVSIVPAMSGQMPKCLSRKSGVHWVSRKNWANETILKKPIVSKMSTPTIPAVVRIETTPQARRDQLD